MAIDRIFQRFDLDLGAMKKLDKERLSELNLPEATRTLRQSLLEKGYEVLESNDVYCGLHGSIIIGGEFGKDPKEDFYELAAKFNLPYRSGHSYFEAKLEQSVQQAPWTSTEDDKVRLYDRSDGH